MFAQVDHPGLGLLMDPTNYFETHNIDRMDQILNQVFDTLTDKIRIAHAKDVKRSGDDKIGEACRHRRRRRAGEPHLPRRRRDRAAGAGPRLAELRPLPQAAGARSTRTFPSSSSICRRTTCRAPRNSSTASSAPTACKGRAGGDDGRPRQSATTAWSAKARAGDRDRPGLGRMVPHRRAAQGDEGADAALRRAGDPRHHHLARRSSSARPPAASISGARGGACRSSSSMACSTARRATRAGTNAATARPSSTRWMNDVVYQIA